MSIKFYCSCGKRLKAKDRMAARRTVCPACGNPVGIPSTQPTHRGTVAAPLSLKERRARQQAESVGNSSGGWQTDLLPPAAIADCCPSPTAKREPTLPLSSELDLELLPQAETDVVVRPPPRKGRLRWRLGSLRKRWFHGGTFPLLVLPKAVGLALVFTLVSGFGILFWSRIVQLPIYSSLGLGLVPLLLMGMACGFFHAVLCTALSGESRPGRDLLKSTALFIVCFVPGPAVLTLIAIYFWLEGGDSATADLLLLAELVLVAIAHFTISLLAVARSGRLRDANPIRAVELVHQLNWRCRILVLAGATLCAAALLLAVDTLDNLEAHTGWLPLFGWWAGFFLVFTFLCRWLGRLASTLTIPATDRLLLGRR